MTVVITKARNVLRQQKCPVSTPEAKVYESVSRTTVPSKEALREDLVLTSLPASEGISALDKVSSIFT